VQAARRVPDRELAHLWSVRFDAAAMPLPRWAGPVQGLLAAALRLVRRAV